MKLTGTPTSGMRRCELAGTRRDLLDLDVGTLAIESTRVVVDGQVIESDGKTENAQHVLALDPFTLAVLKAHLARIDIERREFGADYEDYGLLFCWENGKPPHPDTITRLPCTATRPSAISRIASGYASHSAANTRAASVSGVSPSSTGTHRCTRIGPVSYVSSAKWTVQPLTFAP